MFTELNLIICHDYRLVVSQTHMENFLFVASRGSLISGVKGPGFFLVHFWKAKKFSKVSLKKFEGQGHKYM